MDKSMYLCTGGEYVYLWSFRERFWEMSENEDNISVLI